jgi:hypothetical protein
VENEQAWRVSIDQIKAGNFNLDLKNPHNPDTGPGDVDHLLPEYEKLLAQIAGVAGPLRRRAHPGQPQFLFHSSFTHPPADLRKSILTLAVQGKLVNRHPQQPSCLCFTCHWQRSSRQTPQIINLDTSYAAL